VGNLSTAASATVPVGSVIGENPTAGTSVNAGSAVNLVISSGPAPPHSVPTTNVGVFRAGFFWLLDVDGNGMFDSPPDLAFPFGGIAGDIPITGDWNGNGHTKVGIYRPSNGLFILDTNGDGVLDAGDAVFNFGAGIDPTDIPVVGDWNGSGTSKIGIFRLGFYWLLDANGNGLIDAQDYAFPFGGITKDLPVVGDWNGNGISKVGVFRNGFFWVLDGDNPGDATHSVGSAFAFGGITNDKPVTGKW